MDNKKPAVKPEATEKIVLPKNLQREMVKFFARCGAVKVTNGKDN